MDLTGEETRRLLGEESFKFLQDWLKTEGILTYAVRDEAGTVIAEFEASPRTAATLTYLLTKAVETEREKVSQWMINHSFTTGHGDTLEDLLKELSWQVELLRDASVGL